MKLFSLQLVVYCELSYELFSFFGERAMTQPGGECEEMGEAAECCLQRT